MKRQHTNGFVRHRSAPLTRFRRRIDLIDGLLVGLLCQRTRLSLEVAKVKRRLGLPLRTPAREVDVLRQARGAAKGHLTPAAAERIFRSILSEMRAIQRRSD
jgi:chorismate mutase